MLTNLITSLVIAFGVGVSSVNMDHNINSKVDDVDMTSTIYKYSNSEKIYNQNNIFYFKDINWNDSNIVYKIPSFNDVMNYYGDGINSRVRCELYHRGYNSYSQCDIYFKTYATYYELRVDYFADRDFIIYSLTNDSIYYYTDIFDDVILSKSYFHKSSNSTYNNAIGYLLYYFSQYSFDGAQVSVKDTLPISLFYSDYYNPFVATTSWTSEVNPMVKYMYRGWFEVGGIYYNEIHAEFTSSSGKLFTSSNGNQTTFGSKIMLWRIVFRNTISSYGLLAYQPFYDIVSLPIDRTDDSLEYNSYYLIDSYTDAWRIDYINFVSISPSGLPEYSSTLNTLGYFVPLSQLGDLSNNVSYVDLNQSLNLVSYAFKGLAQFLNIKILPFLNIGTLLLLPLIFVIVFSVVKLFKR